MGDAGAVARMGRRGGDSEVAARVWPGLGALAREQEPPRPGAGAGQCGPVASSTGSSAQTSSASEGGQAAWCAASTGPPGGCRWQLVA